MTIVNYDWDEIEDNIVEEYDDNGATIAEYTTEPEVFGNVISQHRDGQDSFYHFDGQGSTTSLTGSTANVTDTYAYSAFGEVTVHAGATVNPFKYIGRRGYYQDAETNSVAVRERDIVAVYGRWMSVDPLLVLVPFGTAYSYCANRPIVVVDPSGLEPEKDFEKECCQAQAVWSPAFFFKNLYHWCIEIRIPTTIEDACATRVECRTWSIELLAAKEKKRPDYRLSTGPSRIEAIFSSPNGATDRWGIYRHPGPCLSKEDGKEAGRRELPARTDLGLSKCDLVSCLFTKAREIGLKAGEVRATYGWDRNSNSFAFEVMAACRILWTLPTDILSNSPGWRNDFTTGDRVRLPPPSPGKVIPPPPTGTIGPFVEPIPIPPAATQIIPFDPYQSPGSPSTIPPPPTGTIGPVMEIVPR